MVASVAVLAGLLLGFRTLIPVDSGAEAPVESTRPTLVPTTADTTALRLYGDLISGLGIDVAAEAEVGRRINDEWGRRTVEFQATKDAMRALVSRVTALSARLAATEVPPMTDPLAHRRMLLEMSTFVSAASGMSAGLESTDSGEARLAELARFEAAAREFSALVSDVEQSLGSART